MFQLHQMHQAAWGVVHIWANSGYSCSGLHAGWPAPKELAPIAAVWGRQWSGKTVLFCCDNDAVVAVLCRNTVAFVIVLSVSGSPP